MNWWHYTCSHTRAQIGDAGELRPLRQLVAAEKLRDWPQWRQAQADMIWLTDLDTPLAGALGLTSNILGCDRTEHRYRVVNYTPMRYLTIRRDLPARLREDLENAPGAMPAHWMVAYTPVPVVYDALVAA